MRRVMLVDDEPHIHYLMGREVDWAAHGYTLSFHAENGRQAIEELTSAGAQYDVLLTDLNMPVMDGFELIREAAKGAPGVAIVVLSVYSDHANIREAFRLGADDYILKYEIEDGYVIRTIENALRLRDAAKTAFFNGGAEESGGPEPCAAPPEPERAAALWVDRLLRNDRQGMSELAAAWQSAVHLSGTRERSAAQDYYLRLVYAVRDRLIRGGMNEESVSRLCSGEAVLACAKLSEITQFMLALGESLLQLLKREGDAHNHRMIAQAARYIDDNLAQRLTLQKVSGHIGLNASYFSHLFQETRGQSFSQYLTQKRMEAAKRMLMASPGAKIYEIARGCGFWSVEHFSRTFKREVGVSPTRYKLTHPPHKTTHEKGD